MLVPLPHLFFFFSQFIHWRDLLLWIFSWLDFSWLHLHGLNSFCISCRLVIESKDLIGNTLVVHWLGLCILSASKTWKLKSHKLCGTSLPQKRLEQIIARFVVVSRGGQDCLIGSSVFFFSMAHNAWLPLWLLFFFNIFYYLTWEF